MRKIFSVIFLACLSFLFFSAPLKAADRPILVIDSYETSPAKIQPGQSFVLTLKLKNEGSHKASQVMLTLSSSATNNQVGSNQSQSGQSQSLAQSPSIIPDFSTLGSGNIKYVGDIDSKQEKTINFNLAANNISSSKVANLLFNIDYVDGDKSYSSQQSVGIVVFRQPDMIIDHLSYPRRVRVGKRFKISAEIINAGNFSLNGIRVKFSSQDIKAANSSRFIGLLESGDSDVFETKARSLKPGKLTGEIIVNYRDDFNQMGSLVKEINIKAEKAPKPARRTKKSKKSNSFIRFIKALLGIGSTGK